MAPSAVNGDERATIGTDEISKPPPGVVLPPKDIRVILEKTAGYVARNGAIFEDRIREKEKHNPKFSFLSSNDAYNAFYAWRLKEIKEGRGTAIAAGRPGEVVVPVVEPEKPKGPAEPPEFHFSARMPNISAQDLDVVRLTALFVAKNGRSFMTTLSQRETRNFQFDFLRPNHSLYQFFTRLVDQYTELLRYNGVDGEGGQAEKERIRELERNVEDRFSVLGRARQRAEWAKYQEQQKQKKEEEEEKEKLMYAQIDWHDFVVVETVLFNEADDQAELPAPTSLSDLQSASLEQKAMMSLAPHNMRIEEAMPTDDTMYYDPYGGSQQPMQPMQQLPPPPPLMAPPPPGVQVFQAPPPPDDNNAMQIDQPAAPPPPAGAGQVVARKTAADEEDEEARNMQERADARARARQAQTEAKGGAGPMKIRSDYVPRAAAQAANRRGVQMALCPNCKQQIPYNELDAHMRIELLDPRWKEQREKAESRYATTNLSTQDVANNLKRLASQRSDVFDASMSNPNNSTSTPSSDATDEANRRKRLATSTSTGNVMGAAAGQHHPPHQYYYDGHPESKEVLSRLQQQQHQLLMQQMQTANVEEQIRAIHERFGKGGGGSSSAGGAGAGSTGAPPPPPAPSSAGTGPGAGPGAAGE